MTRRLSLLPTLLILIVVSACNRPDPAKEKKDGSAGAPVSGDWVTVRFEAEPGTLNPLFNLTAVGQYSLWGAMNSQIYELLMGYNNKDFGLTEPLLIEAPPTVSDDHLTYTVKVRDGVKWHDGRPFTAEDVLFTFKATVCPLTDAAGDRSYLTDLTDVQVDGRTVRFQLSKANAYSERNVVTNVLPIIPKHVFDDKGLLDGFSFKDMIGPK